MGVPGLLFWGVLPALPPALAANPPFRTAAGVLARFPFRPGFWGLGTPDARLGKDDGVSTGWGGASGWGPSPPLSTAAAVTVPLPHTFPPGFTWVTSLTDFAVSTAGWELDAGPCFATADDVITGGGPQEKPTDDWTAASDEFCRTLWTSDSP